MFKYKKVMNIIELYRTLNKYIFSVWDIYTYFEPQRVLLSVCVMTLYIVKESC